MFLAGRWRSTRTAVTAVNGRFIQLNTHTATRFSQVFGCFSSITNLLRRTQKGRNGSRYKQFEPSPEMIEQELRPAVCEQRQTDLRIIIVQMKYFIYFGDVSFVL